MTAIKAAAVQISPVLYSREGTVDKVVEKIIELGGHGVLFPDPSPWPRLVTEMGAGKVSRPMGVSPTPRTCRQGAGV